MTWSFLPHAQAELFGANDHQGAAALRLRNPISADLDQMRPSLLPNLIAAAGRNRARGFSDVALFEVGPVFASADVKGQMTNAAALRAGGQGPRHWTGADAARVADAFDAKADALAALEACGLAAASVQVAREAPEWFHPGRSGTLRLGTTVIAQFGELHPALLEAMDVKAPMAGFELFLGRIPLPKDKGKQRKLLALSAFQPVERDFAFLVEAGVDADALVRAARGVDKNLIARVDIFDVYSGAGVPAGEKSVALNVIIQPVEKP